MQIAALHKCSKGIFAGPSQALWGSKEEGLGLPGVFVELTGLRVAGPRVGVAQKCVISSRPVSAQVPSLQHRLELPA